MRFETFTAGAITPLLALACCYREMPPPAPAPAAPVAMTQPGPPPAPPPVAEKATPEKEKSDIASQCELFIADEIKAACGMGQDQPHFAFDSAALTPQSDRILSKLADCFKTGPLKGRGMMLVGHADPRGSYEYNDRLGERRAESVDSYLTRKGLPQNRMETSSRGKRDAVGTNEATWALDRRVDVLLLPSGSPGQPIAEVTKTQ